MISYNRIGWLDVAKGITIILMVLGHTSIPKEISNWIWSFHMPLFFIASGLTTNWSRESFSKFVIKKTNSIIRPFIGYSLVLSLMLWQFQIDHPYSKILTGWGGYALWFVPVLFVALIIAKIFFIMSGRVRYCYLMILPAISYLLCYYEFHFSWNMSVVPYAAMFIIIGSYIKWHVKKIQNASWWSMILFLIVTLIISHFWHLDMCYNKIIPMMPLTIGAICGTLFIFIMSIYTEKYIPVLSKIFQSVGRETFLILAFSQIIIQIINVYMGFNVILKYLFLFVILIFAKYIKDMVSKMCRNLIKNKV